METIAARFNRRMKFRNQHFVSPDKRHSYGRNIALRKDGITPIPALIFEKIGQGAYFQAGAIEFTQPPPPRLRIRDQNWIAPPPLQANLVPQNGLRLRKQTPAAGEVTCK